MAISSSQLQTLLAVMKTSSFAAAAEEVGYSPSNVSQQMLALEQETGVRLFTRHARSVTPTEEAFALAKQAARILAGVDVMITSSRAVQGAGKDLLRVGIFPSLAARILPLVLRHPDWEETGVDLRVSVAEPWETADELRSGGLDVAFVFQLGDSSPSWPPSIARDHIAEDSFKVVIPATWGIASNTLMSVDDLSSRPWIMQYPGGSDGIVIEQHLRSHNFRPRVVGVSDDFNATAALVGAGMGGAFLPELSLQRAEGLVRVRVDGLEMSRNIIALTSRERPGSRPQALIRLFREALEGPR
ncbi:LysR family transcriptional regulator [Paenarthrobacter histidinolovorans]|uniref:LysR family transcriptional regulator n=1 Tax=Paenarthrobacter histidinolovorans TaxID=43664 RepID=UPI00166C2BE9|nr:LysR family transcriptional regulator [Paenarthrobacter histidinolovorans]GGJ40562.1 LysR family transcriptional regulator [Paenarthrobacter histidinolovorans]